MPRVPERTCVGCRARGTKADLLRVVRRPDGSVSADRTGRAAGRGAYVHRDPGCVHLATTKGALARALRVPLRRHDLATLIGEIERELP
jgi:predicted RNA-binding protein YlxR (DUF448 family)